MFYKKGLLKNFPKQENGKNLCRSLLFNKVAGLQLYRKETPAKVFCLELCKKILENLF